MKSQPRVRGNVSAPSVSIGSRSRSNRDCQGAWARFRDLLAKPVNGASLAVFRISLGVVMALEAWSLVRPNLAAISTGRTPLETYYTGKDITFHFPYELFGWLPLLPREWIHALVIVQAVAGILMALGLLYRLSAAAVFLTWGYLWVVESTRTYWQSHYYLETLLTFLMIWMPAARRYSVDAWLGRKKAPGDARPPETVPNWTVVLLRGQLLIAYFYAGVAKLNVDWILDAMPVRWFMAQPHVTRPYEPFLGAGQMAAFQNLVRSSEFAYFLSYTGLVFDLVIGFLLLIRRTRTFGLVLMVIFHATNHFLIFDDIDWFPLVGVLTALIFLDPDWPERLWKRLRRSRVESSQGPVLPRFQPVARSTAVLIVFWLTWQTLMPIRHYFIAGNGRFTYEGLSLSWRLKSEARRSTSAQLYPIDSVILSVSQNSAQINWGEWKGEKTLYRLMPTDPIDWRALPEIVVLVEPIVGERIIYNPFAANVTNEGQGRQRLAGLWREMYGRELGPVRNPMPLWKIFHASPPEPTTENGALDQEARMRRLVEGRERPSKAMVELLRLMHPFALERRVNEGAPFLIVDDPVLIERTETGAGHVRRASWKAGAGTQTRGTHLYPVSHADGGPVVVHLSSIGPWFRELLPQACIMDVQGSQAPFIWWNAVKDLTPSKFLHVSHQAFYLRRYARRIAMLWQEQYGRRPVVHANTSVSLNGRPHQELVDPREDLAAAHAWWFRHNKWIRDLETPRIPRIALENPPTL